MTESKSREELVALCKENNIKGYSGKKKGELVILLATNTSLHTSSNFVDNGVKQSSDSSDNSDSNDSKNMCPVKEMNNGNNGNNGKNCQLKHRRKG